MFSYLFNYFLFWTIVYTSAGSEDEEKLTLKKLKNSPKWDLLKYEDTECGESYGDRIIGGKNAALGQYPWLARLGYEDDESKSKKITYKCGGTIINKLYIVTAAHCVKPSKPISVRLGEHDARTPIDCSNGICAEEPQDIKVAEVITHEKYNKPKFSNDIAILKLKKPIDFNGWVGPICLPKKPVDRNSKAEVAGWGVMDMDTLDVADVLQTLTVPLVKLNECTVSYRTVTKLTERQICAGGVQDKDSCGGDSGGPLMQVHMGEEIPQYYLVGVVSFGPTMCGEGRPGVYVNTIQYLDWILDKIKES